MKKILITGQDSYIGTSVKAWLLKHGQRYLVDTIDMRNPGWSDVDFSNYEVVFHVAGIAHADTGNVSEEKQQLYYAVNRDLTLETAQKAKDEGVRHFIFMSSIIIYGSGSSLKEKRLISKDTKPSPDNFYGDSKLQAEREIRTLEDETFLVTILRPPMIYGKGSKGNYPVLAKLACRLKVFPDVKNERSMLFIDYLCECIRLIIDEEISGLVFPQNKEYVRTSDMVRKIAAVHGKKIWITPIFNWLIYLMAYMPGKSGNLVNKAFGSLVYDKSMSDSEGLPINSYQTKSFYETIKETER